MSRRSNIQELLERLDRVKGILDLKKAQMGIYTPPYVELQIEELEAQKHALLAELASLDEDPVRPYQPETPQRGPRTVKEIRQQILWVLYDAFERTSGPVEQRELAELLNLPREKLRSNLEILAAQRLIAVEETAPSGSRTYYYVRLTPEGVVYLEEH